MKNSARDRHARMVGDARRSGPLLAAVAKAVKRGDFVLDIGTGLGILAIAAAEAGASRVVAVDCDAEALALAARAAKKAGVGDLVEFREALSFDLKLRARADVVLCETVGSFAFDENILATLSDAKQRLMKSGGRMMPCKLELWGAPVLRLPRVEMPSETAIVKPADLVAKPARIATADFAAFIPRRVQAKPQFVCASDATIRALAVWPRVTWFAGETTDASPLEPPTHWKQGIMPVEERGVTEGERISFEILIGPHPDDPKRMTERLWRWI